MSVQLFSGKTFCRDAPCNPVFPVCREECLRRCRDGFGESGGEGKRNGGCIGAAASVYAFAAGRKLPLGAWLPGTVRQSALQCAKEADVPYRGDEILARRLRTGDISGAFVPFMPPPAEILPAPQKIAASFLSRLAACGIALALWLFITKIYIKSMILVEDASIFVVPQVCVSPCGIARPDLPREVLPFPPRSERPDLPPPADSNQPHIHCRFAGKRACADP